MKKTVAVIFVIMFSLVCLVGCQMGNYVDNFATDKDNNNNQNQNGGVISSENYTVSVFYNNSLLDATDYDIDVIWQGDGERVVTKLQSDGTSDAGVLDGDYNVYLQNLPLEYSYNPNIYTVTAEKRHVDIMLVDLLSPIAGDGGINASSKNEGIYRDGGCYVINKLGTYRVTCNKGQYFYFEYSPTQSGEYTVTSLANIYEDEINPLLEVYTGNIGYKLFNSRRDTGGPSLSGGYTKNFSLNIKASKSEVNGCYTFGVSAESKDNKYPVVVDFAINYVGEYTSGYEYVENIISGESGNLSVPDENGEWIYADQGTKIFDGRNYVYDENTGLYRVYNKKKYPDTNGYGPFLLCQLGKPLECYDIECDVLWNADHAGNEGGSNYFKLTVWSEVYQSYTVHDYTDFITEVYRGKCDKEGRCYVTKELKEFLQLFAENRSLWTDGVSPGFGTPEAKGYSANQDDLWLFACGFYDKTA